MHHQRGDPTADGPAPAEELHPASSAKAQTKPRTVFYDLGMLGLKIGAIILIGVVLFTFVYGLHYNLDSSMDPLVRDGDIVLFYRWDKDYIVGDLAVFSIDGETQVRRVVAREGDTVDITEQGLMINGALQLERSIFQETYRWEEGVSFPLTVGADEVFVLGDAREGATDSRIYGPVNIHNTKGTAITLLRRRGL